MLLATQRVWDLPSQCLRKPFALPLGSVHLADLILLQLLRSAGWDLEAALRT